MILLIVVLIGYLSYIYIDKYTGNNSYNNNENHNIIDEINMTKFKGYIYVLPDDVFYDIQTNNDAETLHIYSNKDKWGASIYLIDKIKYDDGLFDDYDKLEEYLKNNSEGNVRNKKITNKYNRDIVSFEMYNEENSGLLAYMKAYDNYEYGITLFDGDDKSFDYDALDTVIDILGFGYKTDDFLKDIKQ